MWRGMRLSSCHVARQVAWTSVEFFALLCGRAGTQVPADLLVGGANRDDRGTATWCMVHDAHS